jgi:signal transduction histidine kinase
MIDSIKREKLRNYDAEWYQISEEKFQEYLIKSAVVAIVTYSGGTLLYSYILDKIESFELAFRLLPVVAMLTWFVFYKKKKVKAFSFGHVCYQSLFLSNSLLGAYIFPDFIVSKILLTNIPIILVPALFFTWTARETIINISLGLMVWFGLVSFWNIDSPELTRFFTSNLILAPIVAGTIFYSNHKYKSGLQLFAAYSELEKANKELSIKNEQIASQVVMLDESLRVQDKILSIISHDLKSPLGSLTQLFQIAKNQRDAISKEEFEDLLDSMLLTSTQMGNVLDGLLNWTMARNRKMHLKKERLNARTEISEIISLYTSTAEQKNIEIAFLETQDLYVFADKRAIHVIIRNLISNALKFTKSAGKISIHLRKNNSEVEIIVEDNGLGMTPKKLRELFTNPESTFGTENERGTGLGLALCKEIVELNDGKIRVESEVNVGSKFIVTIPSGAE